jgi:hypothetical protein
LEAHVSEGNCGSLYKGGNENFGGLVSISKGLKSNYL